MAWCWSRALLGVVMSVTLAACSAAPGVPAAAAASGASPVAPYPAPPAMVAAPAETVIAPSGEALARCAYIGAEEAGVLEGQRIDWSCGALDAGGAMVLAGDVEWGEEGWVIARGVLPEGGNEAAPADSALVLGIVLADGTECFSAGTGATAGFQDQRLNLTCGQRAADGTFTALFGELTRGDDGFHILRATGAITADGFQADASDTPTVAALYVES